MKLASFLFSLFLVVTAVMLPSFAFSEKEKTIKVIATVAEHISYSGKNGSLRVTTNIKNGYWIIDRHIVVSRY